MLGALAGCAGVTTNLATRGVLPAASAAVANYRFAPVPVPAPAPAPAQAHAGEPAPAEPLLRAGLAKRGFEESAPEAARYLVSVSSATRPAGVSFVEGDCRGGCEPAAAPALPWFGHPYVHTLTLRFFALPEGREVYKVSAVKRDRNADAQQALPYLVTSALARLPDENKTPANADVTTAGAQHWRVKLDAGDSGAAPAVRSIQPITPITPVTPVMPH